MMNKFNPYGIEKDLYCKMCFAEFYRKELTKYKIKCEWFEHKQTIEGLTCDTFRIHLNPVCPKCDGEKFKSIVHSYQEGSLEEALDGGKCSFGISFSRPELIMICFFNLN
jgi:hypothetical protein